MTNYLITIIGPTAIGKTALSIQLAQHFGCDIISCDSRQFYKETSIGTAVPSKEELAAAKHHFIQNKSILENYNVGDFEREAIEKLDNLFQENNVQVMVGGSGLYINAVLNGFDDFPSIDEAIRTKLNADFEEKGLDYLVDTLKELDIEYYTYIAENNSQTFKNPQRMKRFVEVSIGTGKPYSSFLKKKSNTRNFTPIIVGLEADRELMYDRIEQRVGIMMNEGLLKEVETVFPHKNLNALQTVGYRELFDYLDHKTTLEVAVEEIKKNTRRFAKRQLTWFKRTENTKWFTFPFKTEMIIKEIEKDIK
ncbi:tRNA (adenosine(37)-N6)-dimethylallyltransferase MiaA [Flavobacterium sp.]|jgi:tRNA dimethylallyltransferase|uniref:tRNA (adenosine(37)-N6)-dimethylallyltransferase MiaA n=1 Tax=Flavobacterium sp. TaxID=239 RepID=UPI002A82D4A6|nr:tRNA (adenosine(37)-N6)-dimethylallyltransferase MiaA [Flavobacterium sp.]